MSASKGRETLYKGIRMRSRLEADFAAFLDRNGADWDYEPVCFAGPDGQWLPDFRVRHGETTVYFEIKPESFLESDIDLTLEKMTVAWLTEPTAVLQLTAWTYGDPAAGYSFIGIPPEDEDEMTWWCGRGPDELTAWIGMGQLARTIDIMQREREAAGGAS